MIKSQIDIRDKEQPFGTPVQEYRPRFDNWFDNYSLLELSFHLFYWLELV